MRKSTVLCDLSFSANQECDTIFSRIRFAVVETAMQVAIVGSRDSRELTVDDLIQMIPLNCTRLICSGAEGVDQLARQAP